ncbi:MAG: hypothetical protein IAE97_00980 [Chthoniobacterales bacterium]|nr:hypothetical protein [Chthoniobacterales bacterium]
MFERIRHILAGAGFFTVLFAAFYLSPHVTVTDSRYALLASEVLLTDGTLKLDGLAEVPDYRILESGGHERLFYPAAGSVFSVPFMALVRPFGGSVFDKEGRYDPTREDALQKLLGALLCAVLGILMWRLAAQFTGGRAAMVIAIAASFGSPVWSTASRAVWMDTWGLLLLSIGLLMVVKPLRLPGLIILGSCLSWMYFVKPTYSIPVAAITGIVVWRHRLNAWPLLVTGAVWLVVFVLWSLHTFGTPLPEYYSTSMLKFRDVPDALASHIFSPSRGILVYFPAAAWAVWMVVRNRARVGDRDLVTAAFAVIVLHYVVHAAHSSTAGHCYGARFATPLVPWFVLLAAIGWEAVWREPACRRRFALACGLLLVLWGAFVNGRGAIEPKTWNWNIVPASIDDSRERLWDWRRPQFVADLLPEPLILPEEFPTLPSVLDFRGPDSAPYLLGRWDACESEGRWSMGANAAVIFSSWPGRGLQVRMTVRTAGPQRVEASLNGETVWEVHTGNERWFTVDFPLPATLVSDRNVLEFRFPDRRVPDQSRHIGDFRELGLMVRCIEFSHAK